jgi:ribulose-5-phosphate 4-epimerase/fuculose-1-phosphate aldolase
MPTHQDIHRRYPQITSVLHAMPVSDNANHLASVIASVILEPFPDLTFPARLPTIRLGTLFGGGNGILDVFDRLEVLELAARAFVNSRALGNVAPM